MDETMKDIEVTPKRRKFDEMIDGSIVTVKLHNFMTFTKATYNANPKLNLIIGPNGSGKSSIVTALILGFGGNPKDINRGEKVSQFVKQGKNEADISIELYRKSDTNMKLRRTIFVTNDSCHYYINNIKVSKTKYIECVESFNIKVHNLCQFLPQDRLEDFSKLDSKGLLFNALQSIENQELLDNFKVLKELANNVTSYDDDLNKLKNSINKETDANNKLETIVSSFTEKQTLENELLTVLQKKCWILYITVWDKIKNEVKKFDNIKKYDNCALNIIDQQIQCIKNKKNAQENLKKLVFQNINISIKLIEKISKEVLVSENSVNSIMDLQEAAKNSSIVIEDQEMHILDIQNKIEDLKNEVISVEDYKEKIIVINQNINNIDADILSKKSSLEKVKSKLTSLTGTMYAINQEIERERQKEDGKNQLIYRNYPEMWKAIDWLKKCDKQSIFRGQVFEPLFTQIEVLDKKNAKYIENIVNYRDLIAFVFEFAEDLTTFNKIVKKEGWKKINSISAPPPNIQINETPNYDIQCLKQFGFHSYAMDMIRAPSIIRRYLAKNCSLHNIPIGSEEVMNNIERLPNNITFFFAGNDKVIINMSTYTGEKITRQTQIANEAQLLIFSVDTNLIQSLMTKKNVAGVECEQFEKLSTEFTNQLKIVEDSRLPFFAEKKVLQNKYTMFRNKEEFFGRLENNLKVKQHELKTEMKKANNFITQNRVAIDNCIKSMNLIVELLNNYANIIKTLKASAFIVCNCCVNVTEDNKILKQLQALYMSNSGNFDEYFNYVTHLKNKLKNIKKNALYLTRGVSPYDKTIFGPLKEKFESIEKNDVVDLDVLISEKKAQLNCLNVDPNALQLLNEYKTRKLRIKKLETDLNNLNINRQSKENNIEKLHSKWFPKLQELTMLLNTNFEKFLTLFGCKGLIELDIGDTRYNFEAYGLLIKVQFRNNMDDMDVSTMRLLDAKSQSGGERALTTALFLLALQEVTHFPFRIVDEINQGMDKIYEKKLMELFMELFEDRNNQYLVVTPKLIKNLSFKNTTVDIIFSLDNK